MPRINYATVGIFAKLAKPPYATIMLGMPCGFAVSNRLLWSRLCDEYAWAADAVDRCTSCCCGTGANAAAHATPNADNCLSIRCGLPSSAINNTSAWYRSATLPKNEDCPPHAIKMLCVPAIADEQNVLSLRYQYAMIRTLGYRYAINMLSVCYSYSSDAISWRSICCQCDITALSICFPRRPLLSICY